MSFHSTQNSLGPWNIKGEKKAGSYHMTHVRNRRPPFTKPKRRESLPLRPDFVFYLVLVRRNQGLRRKSLTFVEFLLSRRPNHDSQNAEKGDKQSSGLFNDGVTLLAHRTGPRTKQNFYSGCGLFSLQVVCAAAARPSSERRCARSTPSNHRT